MTTNVIQQAREREMPIQPWGLILIESIAAVIIGLLLLVSPGMTTVILLQFVGIYWLISGLFSIMRIFIDRTMWGWKLFSGTLGILAGMIVIQHPLWSPFIVGNVLVVILGFQSIFIGILRILQASQDEGWAGGILGGLSLLIGILFLANVWIATLSLPFVLGISGISLGVLAIITVAAFRLR